MQICKLACGTERMGVRATKNNSNEHILPIFLINFINILAKTIRYKESFNNSISKTLCLIWLKFEKYV